MDSPSDKVIARKNILINEECKNCDEIFKLVACRALEDNYINDAADVVRSFWAREKLISTGLENGFAIPHAKCKAILKPEVYVITLKNEIKDWSTLDGSMVKYVIALLIPENTGDQHISLLGNISAKLVNKNNQKIIAKNDAECIFELFAKTESDDDNNKNEASNNKNDGFKKVIGVSSCASGVAHTFMAKEAMEQGLKELNYSGHWETQGATGVGTPLTRGEIESADLIIITSEVAINLDRFEGKKVYVTTTQPAIKNANALIEKAFKDAKIFKKNSGKNSSGDIFEETIGNKKGILKHVMSGVSYFVPFVVFAGIMNAILTGVQTAVYGTGGLAPNGSIINVLLTIASVGFTFMMPIMGGFIANSMAGKAAIAPAMITTFVACHPEMGFWFNWNGIFDLENAAGLNIVGAVLFGWLSGLIVNWMNGWKFSQNKYFKIIFPILIIPLLTSAILVIPFSLLLAGPMGWVMYWIVTGLTMGCDINGLNFLMGFIMGAGIGVDFGGPVNVMFSLPALAMMDQQNFEFMAAAGVGFAIAPFGCGLSTLIFRKYFTEDEKSLGISALILGFIGVSEGAIPFAINHTWRTIVASIIGSAIGSGVVMLFHINNYVANWGGVIVAIFGGIKTIDGNYIGILWYLMSIAIGAIVMMGLYGTFMMVWSKKDSNRAFKLTLIKSKMPIKVQNSKN